MINIKGGTGGGIIRHMTNIRGGTGGGIIAAAISDT